MVIVEGQIRCSACGEWKALAAFIPRDVKRGCGECKSCKYAKRRKYETSDRVRYNEQVRASRERRRVHVREYSRNWLASDKDRAKCYSLRKYGIRLEDYQRMLEGQGGGCAICGASTNRDGKSLSVDHCHDTGFIRGILCRKCNSGLGAFKDSLELVTKAAEYLLRAKASWQVKNASAV